MMRPVGTIRVSATHHGRATACASASRKRPSVGMRPWHGHARRQAGVSLIVVMIMMIAATFLGVSAGVIALQGEKAARGDRDRQIAFQAAEAAIIDAQRDIDTVLPGKGTAQRSAVFSNSSAVGFPTLDQPVVCNPASDTAGRGLCRRQPQSEQESWLNTDLADNSSTAVTVPYGYFTGQAFPANAGGNAILPAEPPRYLIELMPYAQPGENASAASFAYRITAIGFGADSNTQVVLQAFYRKEN